MIHLLSVRLLVGVVFTSILSTTYLALSAFQQSLVDSHHVDTHTAVLGSSSNSSSGSSTSEDGLNPVDQLPRAIDEAVRLLYPTDPQRAERYIKRHPGKEFRFYVYDTLPPDRTWQFLSQCIEQKLNTPGVEGNKGGNRTSNCDWGSTICTETERSSGQYSSRRFNRNGDVVLSKLFSEYQGKLRTHDPKEAHVFIVPYASTAHCACKNLAARCFKVRDHNIADQILNNLDYLDPSTLSRHLFFNSAQGDVAHPVMRRLPLLLGLEPDPKMSRSGVNSGHVSIPYVNTNADYQPDRVVELRDESRPGWKLPSERNFAISTIFFRTTIKRDESRVREQYYQAAMEYIGQNKTIGGHPLYVLAESVNAEQEIYDVYKDSIFCPCLRGDTPGQKRLFDAMLNGCIPVVLEYEDSHEKGYPSHFEHKGSSTRIVYPFAVGNFFMEPKMGLDYNQFIVPINGTCGIPCLIPTLKTLILNNPDRIQQMQRNIASVATLFSFGMEHNAFAYPDAVAAALVQARHYVLKEADESPQKFAEKGLQSKKWLEKNNKRMHGTDTSPKKSNKTKPRSSELFICRHVPAVCRPEEHRLKAALKAGAAMNSTIWKIGGFWTSILGFICLWVGIFVSHQLDGDQHWDCGDRIDKSTRSRVTTFSTLFERLSKNTMAYWTDSDLDRFTEPLLTFKLFITLLLFIELNIIMAPEQSILTAAEVISIYGGKYPYKKKHVYAWAKLLMPHLSKVNVAEWVQLLQQIRSVLLCSWFLFLLVPKRHCYLGGICYTVGAIAYAYLGCIGLQYNLAHSTQATSSAYPPDFFIGAMLFILSAIPAIPFLETSTRANHWLRKFLYVGVLGPIYLFSGICKIRYKGILSNLTGEWMRDIFENMDTAKKARVHLRFVQNYIATHPTVPSCAMSWGNIVTELILPISIIAWADIWQLQLVFHAAEILFHVSIFLLIGPNFVRYCLMHVLAANPLGYVERMRLREGKKKQALICKTTSPEVVGIGDWIRVGWAILVLGGWWHVQFKSDLLHLFGSVPRNRRVNSYFPFPELSMFAKPTENVNIIAGLVLTFSTALVQIYCMVN